MAVFLNTHDVNTWNHPDLYEINAAAYEVYGSAKAKRDGAVRARSWCISWSMRFGATRSRGFIHLIARSEGCGRLGERVDI